MSKEVTVKIIICIKPSFDPELNITLQNGIPTWGAAALTLSPFDGYALEAALRLKDALGATLTVLCIGDSAANDALKHTLAMGADEAILIQAPTELDTQGAAHLLAAAVQKMDGADLLIFGRQTLEHASGLTPAQTARALGWPLLSMASAISIRAGEISVERHFEEGKQTVRAGLPAVVSVTQAIGEPRYPSFAGIRKAAKASIQQWMLSAPPALVRRVDVFARPNAPCEFVSAEELAAKIWAENLL